MLRYGGYVIYLLGLVSNKLKVLAKIKHQTNNTRLKILCALFLPSPKVSSPSWNSIVTSCNRNPDGFAVAWHKGARYGASWVKRTLDKKGSPST